MELRQLGYFVALAEELHFGKAAKRLHMAQPPLSQQIQRLERELGVQLFFRSSHNVELTPTGSMLLPQVRETLRAAEKTSRLARAVAAGDVGEVRIGYVSSALYIGLPAVIRRFRRSHPNVGLVLTQASVNTQIESMRHDKLDVGFIRTIEQVPGLTSHLLGATELLAVLPDDHPLAEEDPLQLGMLRDEVFLRFPSVEDPLQVDYITRACAQAGFTPKTEEAASDIQSVIALVAAGLGVSLLPATGRFVRLGGVVFRRLTDPPTTSYSVLYDEARLLPAIRAYLAQVRSTEWPI